MVQVRVEKVSIPTYEPYPYDRNPMFLEKRVYQGSSGRVYPHPVCEGISDTPVDREYRAIFLENDYILVMILPELGGRIQRLYDKTNGYDAIYYNEVVKPALVGLAGPWISGGIEFNWPQHHRPSTFDPVDSCIKHNDDGSVTVTVGETEKMFHTRGIAGFTVYPDKAYLEISGRVYNPTAAEQTFLWWANPAVSVGDHTRSVFPPDVTAVYDHGKRDVSSFPIATGVYYKVDYAPGTDISRYKNIPVPTSYMAEHSDYDFIGNYDEQKRAGLLHVADHHISPGKKQWTWGNGDFGRAWDRNLTDANGPYIELMTGVFTDNQPDFTYLKPYESKSFRQYFMPYRNCDEIRNATAEYAVGLARRDGGIYVCAYSSTAHVRPVLLRLSADSETVWQQEILLGADESFEETLKDLKGAGGADAACGQLSIALVADGEEILGYTEQSGSKETPLPRPQPPLEAPERISSNEELLLAGMHLEQYRHATFDPADYYLEGLKRDPSDIRINNAYGKLLMSKGRYAESIRYFRSAIARSVSLGPNPYDCEPFYNLGIALEASDDTDGAYDAFYKATWDGALQDKAFFRLALIASARGDREAALGFVEQSLVRNMHNLKARGLKTALLRLEGRSAEAAGYAHETLCIDSLDVFARYELQRIGEQDGHAWTEGLRGDNADLIELSLLYIDAGMRDEAMRVYEWAFTEDEPMIGYYRFFCSGEDKWLKAAEAASGDYCFPNRLEDIRVLEYALAHGAVKAGYYLGCLFYDRGRSDEAIALWEKVCGQLPHPTAHRNLALAYFNKRGDSERARRELEEAFELDRSDPRVFFELDRLYKELGYTSEERLANMRANSGLLEKRDPLYTEYITLLNDTGCHEEALGLIRGHRFHPWEGGEGLIAAEYRRALISLSLAGQDDTTAVELLKTALVYPDCLGEGKLIGQLDNDIYYHLALRSKGEERKEYLRLAVRGESSFGSAAYYNDQPPEMAYYRALALAALGEREKAADILKRMAAYGHEHMEDEPKIDYFAVSLPDFLVFETDMKKKNQRHCGNMIDLGTKGLKTVMEG